MSTCVCSTDEAAFLVLPRSGDRFDNGGFLSFSVPRKPSRAKSIREFRHENLEHYIIFHFCPINKHGGRIGPALVPVTGDGLGTLFKL